MMVTLSRTVWKPELLPSVLFAMRSWSFLAVAVVLSLVAAACSFPTSDRSASTPSTLPGITPVDSDPDPLPAAGDGAEPTPPDVDAGTHSVPLEEIHFDTFDGRSVPLSESTAALRARLLDAIPPIDRPDYGDAATGDWLKPGDLVLGYFAGDQAYAYPFKILNFHEIVNDELNGVPVLVSYCPLCRSAIVYDRRVDGEALSFGNTSALYESDLVMVDRSTGSYWWQVAGSAIVGPLTGTNLEPLPSEVATWEDWQVRYPGTLVLTRNTGHSRPYEQDVFAGYGDVVDEGRFAFPVGEAARDPRLPASALVVGVVLDGETRAYPVDGLAEPINDTVGGVPIVVFPTDGGAVVFGSAVNGETLEFKMSAGDIVDSGTGSVWNLEGAAVSGNHRGTRLRAVPSRTTFWFALIGAFPDLEVYRG